jgi:hypothetical protein
MMARSSLRVPNLSKGRSNLSNDALLLEGCDLRSSAARRFRDLVTAYSDELGGVSKLNEVERAHVRQAAALTLQAERLQSSIVRGDAHVDADEIVRLSSEARRCLQRLEGRRKEPQADQSLHEYLSKRESVA